MPLLDWQSKFDLGVDAMDREHKELVATMNHIHDLDQRGAGKAQVDAAIRRLIQLTKAHFVDEERHMEAIGFPDRSRHALIHVDMLAKVAAHYESFQQGSGRVAKAFFDFLVYWLGAHITGIDRKYAVHGTPARV